MIMKGFMKGYNITIIIIFSVVFIFFIVSSMLSKSIQYEVSYDEEQQKQFAEGCKSSDCFTLTSESGCREMSIFTKWQSYPAFAKSSGEIITFGEFCKADSVKCELGLHKCP